MRTLIYLLMIAYLVCLVFPVLALYSARNRVKP